MSVWVGLIKLEVNLLTARGAKYFKCSVEFKLTHANIVIHPSDVPPGGNCTEHSNLQLILPVTHSLGFLMAVLVTGPLFIYCPWPRKEKECAGLIYISDKCGGCFQAHCLLRFRERRPATLTAPNNLGYIY